MPESHNFWLPMAEALMIGALVGAQREHAKLSENMGIREFVLCAAIAAACGTQSNFALSAVALGALIAILLYFRRSTSGKDDGGLTTDLSLLAVFCLSYVCALSESDKGARATAIGLAIVITFLLEAKDKVRKFFGESLTSGEFSGTLLFSALIFIIYPILPPGDFGPYGGFNPQNIWTFVILVSGVSFVGYFLEKYLGGKLGLKLMAVLGGFASTTATTLSFAKQVRSSPNNLHLYWQSCTLANSIQFPRLLAFLAAVSPPICSDAAIPLLAAGGVGMLTAFLIQVPENPDVMLPAQQASVSLTSSESATKEASVSELSIEPTPTTPPTAMESAEIIEAGASSGAVPEDQSSSAKLADELNFKLRNPLTLGPALECGLILAVVIFINKAAVSTLGAESLTWTSVVGGLVDVDAIAVSVADLFRQDHIQPDRAVGSVLLAVCMNAVFKTGIAYTTGSPEFAAKMAISFSAMLGVAALALYFL